MNEPKRGDDRHFRGQPRPGHRIEVRFRVVGGGEEAPLRSAATSNLGVGGAFIPSEAPEPVGTRLAITLLLPSGASLSVTGEVRWIAGEDDPQPGMGVRFSEIAAEQVVALEEYFSSLTETADIDEFG